MSFTAQDCQRGEKMHAAGKGQHTLDPDIEEWMRARWRERRPRSPQFDDGRWDLRRGSEGKWWRMDDASVTPAKKVVSSDAYILFYRRQDVASRALRDFWTPAAETRHLNPEELQQRVVAVTAAPTPKRPPPGARRGTAQ
eukprot:gene48821-17899_t